MERPSLVVLAAGIGSRYGGLKQIDPVGPNGEIIIEYSIYDALRAGFGQIVFVIKEDAEAAFRDRVGRIVERHCETAYVFQRIEDVPSGLGVPPDRHKPWGTAHATFSARDVVDVAFAVINADDFYGRSAYQALGDYLKGAEDRAGVHDYCMVGYLVENTLTEHGYVARGVCSVDEGGVLVGIRERTRIERFGEVAKYTKDGQNWVEIPKGNPVSMNMWGFTPSLFAELRARFPRFLQENRDNIQKAEFFLPDVVGDLIQEGRATVKVLPANERWFGVTYQQDKPRVKKAVRDLISQGIYPENLWQDVKEGFSTSAPETD
ncbi:sugar phosphate nucleotidyltransferase [Chloroflexota bacterium]